MDFTVDGKYLISVGVQGEDDLAVFNISQNLVVRHHLHKQYAINHIKVDPMVGSMMKRINEDGTESMVENNYIYFVTCGNDAALQRWRYDVKEQELQCYTAEVPDSLKGVNFVCLDFTHYLP